MMIKAFDPVDWINLMELLQKIQVDWNDRRFIWNLHNGQALKQHMSGLKMAI